ncbi:M23 family metallopeptidase [Candidatus Bipolaricaulota bacterium]|nr:M23 family metallopeptidase [Candidatus Bipolaricaulota bacterium]
MNKDLALAVLVGLFFLPLLLLPLVSQEDLGGPLSFPPIGSGSFRTYVVRSGDTLAGLADRYGIPLSWLVASNGLLAPGALYPGQELVLPQGGVLHTLRPGQGLADLAATYGVSEEEIRKANGLSGDPLPGQRLLIPEPRIVPQAAVLELGGEEGGRFIWPLKGRLTSLFGPRTHPIYGTPDFHTGIDLAVPEGTQVHAAAPGTVTWAGTRGGYGLLVILDHGDGYSTYYGHLSQIIVHVGQFVEVGQVIGFSGNTGLSTGPHLHFEIRNLGEPIDPLPLLP